MACPHQSGTYFHSCSATAEPYVPSRFQTDEYCSGRWHTLCPFFRERRERDLAQTGSAGASRPAAKPVEVRQ